MHMPIVDMGVPSRATMVGILDTVDRARPRQALGERYRAVELK